MSKLAVFGGDSVVPEGLVVHWPNVTQEDKAAVMAVLDRGILWGEDSPETAALEKEWAEYVGTRFCLATNSGTAALHMAVAAAGIGPGDEVITSALTFLASASCVLHHNAIPVFADIDPDTFNVTAQTIAERITERTKAIIPVHLHGLPADMDEILALARKHGLTVIEDACQAHGATYKGRKVGGLADSAAFSLNTTKNLAGGEGGVIQY
jgi:dTDP-4-amino-4,6-dideoxygalactose transaminase